MTGQGGNRAEKRCPVCKKVIFDGQVIKARVVKVPLKGHAEAKCGGCKQWVQVPLVYAA